MKGGLSVKYHIDFDKYITVAELAERYGKSYTQAWYAVKSGKIPSIRVKWQYLVNTEDLPQEWPVKEY
jgi:hypothetical protein